MDVAWVLKSRLERFILEESLLKQGDGVVVAVSGGPDSVALLHLLFGISKNLDLRLTVAHVNHCFRGAESDEEAELVAELSRKLGLQCRITRIDMPAYLKETGANSQALSRAKRYAFFREVAKETGAGTIATAHHADDQAETVMMRILRGTGLTGLSGIPLRRKEAEDLELIRPLLRMYKEELIQYCEAMKLPYRIDSSNLKLKYLRNQIRQQVLPYLSAYNERLPEALNRLAEVAAQDDELLSLQAKELFDSHVEMKEGILTWSAAWFGEVHVALQRRLIKLILSYLALDPETIEHHLIERIRKSVLHPKNGGVRSTILPNITLSREYDRVSLHTMVLPTLPYSYEICEGERELFIPETGARITFSYLGRSEKVPEGLHPNMAVFDISDMSFPLTIRSRISGDRMQPLGLIGSKKVKDMLIDAKIPPSERDRIPVITNSTGLILWIPGLRRSSYALIEEGTERKLVMELHTDYNLQ